MKKTIGFVTSVLAILVTLSGSMKAGEVQEATVRISGMHYTPGKIAVEKGVPVRIEFTRDDKPTCGGTILFPELGLEREVEAGQSTVVEFTPENSGELSFTCGMKMMKGKIVVQ